MDRVRFVRDDLTSSGCPSDGSSVVANTSTCLQTEYDYDAPGNLTYVKRVGALGGAPVATTIETKNWHDSIGRKYQMSDPDMGTWYYTHTPFGELDTQTDAKGQFTDLGYDRLGRVTRRLEKLSVNGAIETDTNFVFDTAPMGVGKIASVSTNNGFSEWTSYDSLGRFSQSKRQLDGAYYYVDQTYDGLGRPDVLKYPGSIAGDTVSGPETDANRVRVRNNYNSYGYLSSVQDVASGTSYWNANAVDENGGVTQETLGNGRVTKRFFDRPTGYISTIKTGSAANDSEVQNLEFGFDQAANLRTRKDSTTGVNGDNGIREEYNYDKLYRLTQMRQYKPASSAGPQSVTENYTYDDFGNLLSKGTNYNDYCYIARNVANDPCAGVASVRPHAAKRVKLGATTRDYSYDANGNVTAATFSMFDSVTWNVSNLPKRISKGTKYSEFSYGADRARFKQYLYRAANDTETTIYVGSLYEKLTKVVGGTPTVEHTHYIAVNGNVVTLAKRTGTGSIWLRYPHRDQLGSIVALTNESGALVERSGFDPWGKRTSYATWDATTPGTYTAGGTGTGGLLSGMLSTKRGFTYHEHVEELGFVHMNGRVYDNEIGRFLSADPFIQFPLSTQGFNRYSYVGNNPLSYTDPSGFEINKGALGKVLWEVGAILTNFGGWIEWVGRLFMAVGAYLQNRGNTQAWLAWLTNSLPKYNVSFAPTPSQSMTYGGGSTTSQPPPVPVNSFGPITFPLDFHYNKEGTAGGIARGGWEIVVQIWNYPVIEHRVQVKRYVGTMSPGGKGNIFGVSGALYAPVFDSARKPVTQVVSSISVGDVVLTAATIIPVVAGLRAAFVLEAAVARGLGWSAARGSGTVWESITVTQAAKSGTAIPHSFELATAGGKFWVHPNATKHMVEFVTRNGGSQGMQMNSQAMLSSLHASVEQAASQGIRFGQTMQVGRWELIFSQARTADELPVLIHALYR
jgi:RHS repeat-associated protein